MRSRPSKQPISRDKNHRTRTPSLKVRSNEQNSRVTKVSRVKKAQPTPNMTEHDSTDEDSESAIPKPKVSVAYIPASYLIHAQTFLGVQRVYNETKATIECLWSATHYFQESARSLEKAANNRGVEPKLKSSIATISTKSMKPAEFIQNDVAEPKVWMDVESVVHHLATSGSKSIRVDFIMKYEAKMINDDSDVEYMSEEGEKLVNPAPKPGRKVYLETISTHS